MSDNLLSLARSINDTVVKRDDKVCYPAIAGFHRGLLTQLAIEVGAYGDSQIKKKVQAILENHLNLIQQHNS